ncbi:uncharacterized protein LOC130712515 [Lotus japonicus]|uniref:uncharacterized protein LOC130712515 n=1 Tax=Lotus japonicus TaxID=34305 RepID=UPI00258A277A|nr:uncharacterized protein LOC130712515 [Lotus japonicus]
MVEEEIATDVVDLETSSIRVARKTVRREVLDVDVDVLVVDSDMDDDYVAKRQYERLQDRHTIPRLRMDTNTFRVFCSLLHVEGRLKEDGLVPIEEQVAMFLHVLAHHAKDRVIKFKFQRSGETISIYFNLVLSSVLRLQKNLLKTPYPIPEDCIDNRWKWFKGCLGALDGTYIRINVFEVDKPRYRSRKGEIATNVLGVCSRDMQFIYVLPGWEGSASDARVLHDAINRRNGLKVPTGKYYLVDGGYTNGEGFLAPYRGI